MNNRVSCHSTRVSDHQNTPPKHSVDVTRAHKAVEFVPWSYFWFPIKPRCASTALSVHCEFSDASGYTDKRQTLKLCNREQIWRTENETCCRFTKTLPGGNKMLDQQGVSAMWVNQLREHQQPSIWRSLARALLLVNSVMSSQVLRFAMLSLRYNAASIKVQ